MATVSTLHISDGLGIREITCFVYPPSQDEVISIKTTSMEPLQHYLSAVMSETNDPQGQREKLHTVHMYTCTYVHVQLADTHTHTISCLLTHSKSNWKPLA